jgi:hypothetical protein
MTRASFLKSFKINGLVFYAVNLRQKKAGVLLL